MSTLKTVNLQNPASGIVNGTLNANGTTTFGGVITFAAGQTFPNAISSLTAGTGLTGGTITSTGTFALDTAYTDGLYLQLVGGVMTGDITFSGTQTFPAQDLDEVTTAGNSTANGIDVGSLIAASLTYPVADGVLDDVLTTDGAGTLSFTTPIAYDLQIVTDNGAVTTNPIDVAGLTAASLIYPLADGALDDVLTTDGAGTLSFTTPIAYDLQLVTDNGAVTTNVIDVAGLTAASLIYPPADGTADQVMTTDGGGTLGWSSVAQVVAAPTSSLDPGLPGQVASSGGNFYYYDGTGWLQLTGVIF